jgi:hypothetical protein
MIILTYFKIIAVLYTYFFYEYLFFERKAQTNFPPFVCKQFKTNTYLTSVDIIDF